MEQSPFESFNEPSEQQSAGQPNDQFIASSAGTDDNRGFDDGDGSERPGRAKDNRVRLNKAIADSGHASRRQADRLIEEGNVTVNGKRVFELGIKVDPSKDKILVGGKPLKAKAAPVYAMLNKPKGMLTTMEDPEGRPTIKEFIEELPVRLFPVGRLDWDSEGLLLLTNDGDWAQKIMHPREEITKTYLVKVSEKPRPEALQKLRTGVSIIGGKVYAKYVSQIERGKDKHPWLKIVITEGKNRQIRLMFEKIGLDVLKLQRIAIGRLRLGSLERGKLVFLNDAAADLVFQADMSGTDQEKRSSRRQVSNKRSEDRSRASEAVAAALREADSDSAPQSRRKQARAAQSARKASLSRGGRPSGNPNSSAKTKPITDRKIRKPAAKKSTKRNPLGKTLNLDDLE